MSKAQISVLDSRGRPAKELTIQVNGRKANFIIKADRLEDSFWQNLDARLADFIDISSCIFAADSQISRGGATRADFGQRWRRWLRIRFFVRDPIFWNQPAVSGALRDAVQFMSDDRLDLEFVQAGELPSKQITAELGTDRPMFEAEDVIMFSGGLDSLAGVYDRLSSGSGRVILLTHFSSPKRMKYPRLLVQKLKQKFPKRILWVGVSAHLKDSDATETTQRTRSLLFACLGFVAARLSGARRLHFYENGIVSANLPISAQVIGSMASRTTHPETIAALLRLLDAIAPGQVALANPYDGLTKAEVAGRLGQLGGADLIRMTVSCSHVRQQTVFRPHCGACSQCLDRRFGVLAAGLGDDDPAEGYETDVLKDARETEASRLLAFDWSLHALRLEQMSDDEFLRRFGTDLARLVGARPDLMPPDHARSILGLHQRHGRGVRQVFAAALANHSDAIMQQSLPPTSLLRMILSKQLALPAISPALPMRTSISGPPHGDVSVVDANVHAMNVEISGTATTARVAIAGLGEVVGVNATPAWALAKWHLEDKVAKLAPQDYRFVTGGEVSQTLAAEKDAVRGRIKRMRDDFAELYEAIEGVPPMEPILIKSGKGQNYRIDPSCNLHSTSSDARNSGM